MENKLIEKKDSLNNFIGLIWKLLITLSILVQLSVGSVQGLTMYNDNYRLIARHVMSIMIGLVLFSLVNLSRHLDIDPELSLKRSTEKFIKRFKAIENEVDIEKLSLEELDQIWNKNKEKNSLKDK